ncbi:MAG: DUF6382 domain-containing protein [Alkaliphilus sp.]
MQSKCEKIKASYISDAKASYYVVEVDEEGDIYEHQIKVLCKNPVHSILPFRIINKEEGVFIYYDITSKQTLDKMLLRRKLKRNELIKILVETCKIILKSDNYLLVENNFLISDKNIYINPYTLEISLIYLPLKSERESINTRIVLLVNKLILALDEREDSVDSFIHKTMVETNKEDFSVKKLLNFMMLKLFENGGAKVEKKIEERNNKRATRMEVDANSILSETKNAIVPKMNVCNKETMREKAEKIMKNTRKKKEIVFVLIQILAVLLILLIVIETNIFLLASGEVDITALLATLLIVGALSVLLYKRMFVIEKVATHENVQKNEEEKNNQEKERRIKKKEMKKNEEQIKKVALERLNKKHHVKGSRENKRGETNIFATVLLDTEDKQIATLSCIKEGNPENIIIDNNPFIIGKLKEQVDCRIASNTVSRIHAEINYEKGTYYITDLNSKNGTKLNGKRVDSNKKHVLNDRDIIKIASEQFQFNL